MNEFVSLDDYSTSIGCPVSIHSVLLRSWVYSRTRSVTQLSLSIFINQKRASKKDLVMHFLLEIWLQKIFLTSPCPACLYHSVEVYTTYICMVILHQAKKRKIWTFFHDFRQGDIRWSCAKKSKSHFWNCYFTYRFWNWILARKSKYIDMIHLRAPLLECWF